MFLLKMIPPNPVTLSKETQNQVRVCAETRCDLQSLVSHAHAHRFKKKGEGGGDNLRTFKPLPTVLDKTIKKKGPGTDSSLQNFAMGVSVLALIPNPCL